jgi:hypothetical protein
VGVVLLCNVCCVGKYYGDIFLPLQDLVPIFDSQTLYVDDLEKPPDFELAYSPNLSYRYILHTNKVDNVFVRSMGICRFVLKITFPRPEVPPNCPHYCPFILSEHL